MSPEKDRLSREEATDELFRLLAELQENMPPDPGFPESLEDYRLERTCFACPEQYDVFDKDGVQCGYLRLRHGSFRADYPDCGGETVYRAEPKGDGIFDDDEREFYLNEAIKAIKKKHENQ